MSRSTWPETIEPAGITETGAATGQFVTTINTTGDVGVSAPTPMIHTLETGSNDITVSYYLCRQLADYHRRISLTRADSTPSVPIGLSGVMAGNGANMTATLSWDEVTTNDNGVDPPTAITDLVGYYVWEKVCAKNKPNCTGGDIVADWFLRAAIAADATPSTPGA